MDFEIWLAKAETALERIRTDVSFKLRDLYAGHEWESLSKGDRLRYGKYFSNQVKIGKVKGVEAHGKAENNSSLYIKKLGGLTL
jgi:hypothetical protein